MRNFYGFKTVKKFIRVAQRTVNIRIYTKRVNGPVSLDSKFQGLRNLSFLKLIKSLLLWNPSLQIFMKTAGVPSSILDGVERIWKAANAGIQEWPTTGNTHIKSLYENHRGWNYFEEFLPNSPAGSRIPLKYGCQQLSETLHSALAAFRIISS